VTQAVRAVFYCFTCLQAAFPVPPTSLQAVTAASACARCMLHGDVALQTQHASATSITAQFKGFTQLKSACRPSSTEQPGLWTSMTHHPKATTKQTRGKDPLQRGVLPIDLYRYMRTGAPTCAFCRNPAEVQCCIGWIDRASGDGCTCRSRGLQKRSLCGC
jgi:hypothetical protein